MAKADKDILISARDVTKTYTQGGSQLTVLDKASLELREGEIVALVGPSGSGKSTLLHLLGLLDTPTSGEVHVGGQLASSLSDKKRTILRRTVTGFVYQFHHLQPEFSALENIVLPQMINGVSRKNAEEKALAMLKGFGLEERASHRPSMMSGGEQQRVAIARALANDPKVLIADVPTGNLDPETSDKVFDILLERTRVSGASALIATHNMDLAKRMDRTLIVEKGRLRAL